MRLVKFLCKDHIDCSVSIGTLAGDKKVAINLILSYDIVEYNKLYYDKSVMLGCRLKNGYTRPSFVLDPRRT